MESKKVYLGLDVGTRRIGVAVADSIARLARPVGTIEVDETTPARLRQYLDDLDVSNIVVGLPRNQSGAVTAQTALVKEFAAAELANLALPIHWQDESVTSVIAEERLQARKKPYSKADIDAEAAAIILQDFVEAL
jgi:putative pre-16S rRNA nuclease